KLFGGGRMFHRARESRTDLLDIGARNVAAGRKLLLDAGFRLKAEHVAGRGHRSLLFDIGTGEVWLRHVPTVVAEKDPTP
ncbi:chemotaxis protein CheD, partial [Arthrospira platensis SPKY1]|nr:chemotaxis protein CheD [Arthrospira platensis SPKY1]